MTKIKNKKLQASVEFLILMSLFLFFFTIFVSMVGYYNQKVANENKYGYLNDITQSLQTELQFAQSLEPGYHRKIRIPRTINGELYSLIILNSTELNSSMNISEIIAQYNGADSNLISVAIISGNVNVKSPIRYGEYNNITLIKNGIININ